jgi:hypothetical protein
MSAPYALAHAPLSPRVGPAAQARLKEQTTLDSLKKERDDLEEELQELSQSYQYGYQMWTRGVNQQAGQSLVGEPARVKELARGQVIAGRLIELQQCIIARLGLLGKAIAVEEVEKKWSGWDRLYKKGVI